jgi:hypothetical protein
MPESRASLESSFSACIQNVAHCLSVVALGLGIAATGRAQANSLRSQSIPAATFSQFECSGFIAAKGVPDSVRVFNGADDDLYEPLHQFATGDYVYLRRSDHQPFIVGQAYSLVRPENGFRLQPVWLPGMIENQILPPGSLYPLQRLKIESLGRPYDRTGIVRVSKVTPQGAIAKVVFTCNGISVADIALPYVPQALPAYNPSIHPSRFALPNGKLSGIIVAGAGAATYLGQGSIGFVNIGKKDGVLPGQRFRIFAIFRDNLPEDLQGAKPRGRTPRETVGELVILHVRAKSATGIVVHSLRQIAVGDGVELE